MEYQESYDVLRSMLVGMLGSRTGSKTNATAYRRKMVAIYTAMCALHELSRGGDPDNFVEDPDGPDKLDKFSQELGVG